MRTTEQRLEEALTELAFYRRERDERIAAGDPAAAERRRIRRAIAPHLSNLYRVNDQHNLPYVKGAADAIDRATKVPKRKTTKENR
jgi:hypothetical protein